MVKSFKIKLSFFQGLFAFGRHPVVFFCFQLVLHGCHGHKTFLWFFFLLRKSLSYIFISFLYLFLFLFIGLRARGIWFVPCASVALKSFRLWWKIEKELRNFRALFSPSVCFLFFFCLVVFKLIHTMIVKQSIIVFIKQTELVAFVHSCSTNIAFILDFCLFFPFIAFYGSFYWSIAVVLCWRY